MFQTATRQLDPLKPYVDASAPARVFSLNIRSNHGRYPLELPQTDDGRLVFGRIDPGRASSVNIDLSEFDGRELGVSRLHAVIDLNGTPTLTDLDSANGTWLNGERLLPHEIRRLFSGDVICFGMLVLYVNIA